MKKRKRNYMSLNIDSKDNSDFKYEMNDLTILYYGARYSYQEIVDDKITNFKLKRIIMDYFLREVTPDTTIESHLYYMTKESQSYLVYDQLKAKVRVSEPYMRKKLFGGQEQVYREVIYSLKDLVSMTPEEKKSRGILIREIQISKLGLMAFTL